MKANTERYPKDIKRLRISKLSFRRLLSHFEVPPAFIKPMLSTSLASLSYHHRKLTVRKRPIIDFFYVLPVRVAVTCDEVERSHILSSAGSNQMNPSQYLHLTDVHRDIRPSKIAVYLQHDEACHQTSTICIDFQDGRAEYSDFADEPLLRAREVLQRATRAKNCEDPFFIHLVLLTSVAEWWRCALMWFNAQLIVYVRLVFLLSSSSLADVLHRKSNFNSRCTTQTTCLTISSTRRIRLCTLWLHICIAIGRKPTFSKQSQPHLPHTVTVHVPPMRAEIRQQYHNLTPGKQPLQKKVPLVKIASLRTPIYLP